ncbi:hypothetical protein ACF0H5_006869 [Mactra antiquata]
MVIPNDLYKVLCVVVVLCTLDLAYGRPPKPRNCTYLGEEYMPGELMYQVYDLDLDTCFYKECGKLEESEVGQCVEETDVSRGRSGSNGSGKRPCKCRYDGTKYDPDTLITMLIDGDNCTVVYCNENGRVEYEDEDIEECTTTTPSTEGTTDETTEAPSVETTMSEGRRSLSKFLYELLQRRRNGVMKNARRRNDLMKNARRRNYVA